jgi:hypothetical protein
MTTSDENGAIVRTFLSLYWEGTLQHGVIVEHISQAVKAAATHQRFSYGRCGALQSLFCLKFVFFHNCQFFFGFAN